MVIVIHFVTAIKNLIVVVAQRVLYLIDAIVFNKYFRIDIVGS
jgi:hypothetical protein